MDKCIRILHLEDDAQDAELVRTTLRSGDLACQITRVQTRAEFTQALHQDGYDVILADYRLPMYDGMSALRLTQEVCPDVPFIFVSGTMGEDAAIAGLTEGATDYVLKQKLSHLAPAVTRALREAENRKERQRAEAALRDSEARYRRITEAITDYMYTVRIEGEKAVETRHGPGCLAVTGYTDEAFAADPYLWIRMVVEADRPAVEEQARRVLAGEPAPAIEHRIIRQDGTLRWVCNTPVPRRDGQGVLRSYDGLIQDITARKQAEEALRESERLLADIAANYPNSYVSIIERDLTVGFTSGQAFTKQHLDPRSFVGSSLEHVFGEHAPTVRQQYLKTFQGEETSFELCIRNQDQLFNVVPLYDSNGHIPRILAVVENITARKQAEKELQRANDLLRAIIEAAPIAIIGLDLDGNVQMVWNPTAEKMLGWSAREVMGRLLPSVPVEGQEEFRRFREWTRSGQTLDGVEVRRQKRDGSPIDYSIYASPLHDAEGRIVGNVAVLVDITARKRAEIEIRTLSQAVEQSPAAIVITDPAGAIQYVNPRFTHMTGYTPDDVIGKNPRILKSGETPPEAYQRLWNIITHGGVWRGEFHNKQKNGDLYWESASISPVCDAQGAITHFLAVKEDITERKRTEEALRLLNEELELRVSQRTAELEAKNTELHEFAYIVSHDLKAPLRGINRLTQWLQEDYAGVLDTQGQKQLDLLSEQATRMDDLIDGILRYSRAGRSNAREEAIDLNPLVSQAIDMLMPPAHIAIRIDQPLPVIHGDPIQLTQVFQNLLSNAVKFMDKPAGAITVVGEDAGDMWVFRVDDNGPGIDPRHHERIFKIFQSGAPRDDRDSTGIGLAVVKKIVEIAGGRVWVESTPGQGSRFSFTWPKRPGEAG